MLIIATINQKGGVGKTTTVANLAAALAVRGRAVAVVDMDPQSHLTMHFGLEPGGSASGTYEILTEQVSLSAAAVCVQPSLWLIPASIDLAGAEIELASTAGREQLLADRFAKESLPYEYVFIDCPPSLGLLTLNALVAADEVIIPLQPHFLALQGFGKLLETVGLVQRRINPRLRVCGVVLCMFETNTRLATEVSEDVANFLADRDRADTSWAGAKLFETRIRRNIKLAECPGFGRTISAYAPHSSGAADYEALAEEFLATHGRSLPREPAFAQDGQADAPDEPAHQAPSPALARPLSEDPRPTSTTAVPTEPVAPGEAGEDNIA